jgi:hypothetical protein
VKLLLGQQLGDGRRYSGALLTHVEPSQVETKNVHLSDKVSQATLGDSFSAVPEKASSYHQQVLFQLRRAPVGHRGVRVLERTAQAGGHEEHLAPVGLVILLARELPDRIGQEPLVPLDGALELFRDGRELYRLAQMLSQGEGEVQVAFEGEIPVQAEGCVQGLWFHERVAVLISADPGAELQDAPQRKAVLGKLAGELVFEVSVHVEGRGDQGPLEEEQGPLYLVFDRGPLDAQLVSLPQDGYLLGEGLLRLETLPGGEVLDL